MLATMRHLPEHRPPHPIACAARFVAHARRALSACALLAASLLPAVAEAGSALRPLMAFELVPLGRGDVSWALNGPDSGTFSAETDGLIRPPLTVSGGVVGRRFAWLGGLGIIRSTTTTITAAEGGDQRSVRRVGALRPSADMRWYLHDRGPGRAIPYLTGGAYGLVPMVDNASEQWTKEEQEAWDEVSKQDRARIGGVGFQGGVGGELQWSSGLAVGGVWRAGFHRGQLVDDEAISASVLITSSAALTLSLEF
jgi:hypothetical protein